MGSRHSLSARRSTGFVRSGAPICELWAHVSHARVGISPMAAGEPLVNCNGSRSNPERAKFLGGRRGIRTGKRCAGDRQGALRR
jgi:hypothetical protein